MDNLGSVKIADFGLSQKIYLQVRVCWSSYLFKNKVALFRFTL